MKLKSWTSHQAFSKWQDGCPRSPPQTIKKKVVSVACTNRSIGWKCNTIAGNNFIHANSPQGNTRSTTGISQTYMMTYRMDLSMTLHWTELIFLPQTLEQISAWQSPDASSRTSDFRPRHDNQNTYRQSTQTNEGALVIEKTQRSQTRKFKVNNTQEQCGRKVNTTTTVA